MNDANQPTLLTERLRLRPVAVDDMARLVELIGDWNIFDTTEAIPHPYTMQHAREYLTQCRTKFVNGEDLSFAIEQKNESGLIGCIALHLNQPNRRARIGYWIGVPFWNRGFMSEALTEILRYGFETLDLNRIDAQHLKRNPASGRVTDKAGMRFEVELPKYAIKHAQFEDIIQRVIYADEYSNRSIA